MSETDPDASRQRMARRKIAAGFCTAVGGFALAFLFPPSREIGPIVPFLLAMTIIPLAAIITSIIRSSRKFGLGMLLGCGVIWLAMLAICGGAFR